MALKRGVCMSSREQRNQVQLFETLVRGDGNSVSHSLAVIVQSTTDADSLKNDNIEIQYIMG